MSTNVYFLQISPQIFIDILDYDTYNYETVIDTIAISNLSSLQINNTCKTETYYSVYGTSVMELEICFRTYEDNQDENGTCSFGSLPAFVYNCSATFSTEKLILTTYLHSQ